MSSEGQLVLEQIQQQLTTSIEAAETVGWDDVEVTPSGTIVVRKYANKDAAELERQRLDHDIL
ncbi:MULTISPECIES: hypothetical protein [unclassified Halomonas]|uniref:hypothetical protein n=1 Tax=unclassified Halomonas TaxID=2609666 RepID=UPI001C955678|nr:MULTISPECIES: hypothetical protein [unclassified Halomonas]MBY5925467.1 hypothetical protein [Halomonas sp. DP4Y7-2]MBY6232714.1 hypothetical protein [Halomonas sp. DP4Y7-1]